VSRLELARDEQIDEVYRESHRLWGAGLTYEDYRGLWRDLAATPWARRWVRFYVWTDGAGDVLSSMKLYRPCLRVGGRSSRVSLFGAVFTPAAHRGQGHAAAMMRSAIEEARERGDAAALLYSDIGTRYYAGFGFRALPAHEHWGRLPPAAGPPPAEGFVLRSLRETDLEAVSAAYDASSAARPFAIVRDAEHWAFLRLRADGFFARLRDFELVQQCRIATRAGAIVGYLITVEGRGEWNVREVGALDGEVRTIEILLRLGAREARQRGMHRVYGWLPPEVVPRLRDFSLRERPRRRALPMILALDESIDTTALVSPEASYLTFQDQF
jgi:predicted N-acetyltransferase YhbS